MRTGPLTSLKVIELCNVVAGPFAGSLLADWGRGCHKIEMPGKGDPFRAFLPYDDANHEVSLRWITMGRNKRCVTLDLHGEKGHKILLDLVQRCRSRYRELPPRHAGKVGHRLRRDESRQPQGRAGAHLRLRPDRPLPQKGGPRHASYSLLGLYRIPRLSRPRSHQPGRAAGGLDGPVCTPSWVA